MIGTVRTVAGHQKGLMRGDVVDFSINSPHTTTVGQPRDKNSFCVGKPGLGTGFPTQNGLLAIFGQLNFPDRWCIRKD